MIHFSPDDAAEQSGRARNAFLTLAGIVGMAAIQAVVAGALLKAMATIAETVQETQVTLLRTERLIARAIERKEPESEPTELDPQA